MASLSRQSWGKKVPSHVQTQALAHTQGEAPIKKLGTALQAERRIRKAKNVKARSQN